MSLKPDKITAAEYVVSGLIDWFNKHPGMKEKILYSFNACQILHDRGYLKDEEVAAVWEMLRIKEDGSSPLASLIDRELSEKTPFSILSLHLECFAFLYHPSTLTTHGNKNIYRLPLPSGSFHPLSL